MGLELVTTEKFNGLDCNFYRNEKEAVMVTREQIGAALGYSEPRIAIEKIHKRYKDRLDQFSVVTRLEANDGKQYETYLYSERGVMEICRWSRQPKANAFIDFTWDIMEAVLRGEYGDRGHLNQDENETVHNLLQQNQLLLQQISLLNQKTSYDPPKRTRFKKEAFDKLRTLVDRDGMQMNHVIHNIISETEDAYGIYLHDYENDYIRQTGIVKPQVLDVIEYYPDVRKLFETTLNSMIDFHKEEWQPTSTATSAGGEEA